MTEGSYVLHAHRSTHLEMDCGLHYEQPCNVPGDPPELSHHELYRTSTIPRGKPIRARIIQGSFYGGTHEWASMKPSAPFSFYLDKFGLALLDETHNEEEHHGSDERRDQGANQPAC